MVKCSECGFLAIQNMQTRNFEEAEEAVRTHGIVTRWIIEEIGKVPLEEKTAYPYTVCFMRKRKFPSIEPTIPYNQANYSAERSKILKAVLGEEIVCDGFREWDQGFSPKEHREMFDREQLLKWQTDEAGRNRRYRLIEIGLVLLTIIAILATALIRSDINVTVKQEPASQSGTDSNGP